MGGLAGLWVVSCFAPNGMISTTDYLVHMNYQLL